MLRPFFAGPIQDIKNYKSKTLWSSNAHKQVNFFVTRSAHVYVCFVDIFVPFSAAFWYRSFFVRPLLPSIVRRFSSDKISDMSPKSELIFIYQKE